MGLRSFFGLCEHRWRDTGGVIRMSVATCAEPNKPRTTGYKAVRECERCGEVRGFRL